MKTGFLLRCRSIPSTRIGGYRSKKTGKAFPAGRRTGFYRSLCRRKHRHRTRQRTSTSCVAFLAWVAAAATKRIKARHRHHQHAERPPGRPSRPLIAMLDHMLDGRLIFGISPGRAFCLMQNCSGNLDADRNAMFLEAINQVLQIWASEPPLQYRRQILEHFDAKEA